MKRHPFPCVLLPTLALAACTAWEPLPIPPSLLALEGVVEYASPTNIFFGVEVAPNESDSLDELEIRPGVRVVSVARDSPAGRAQIRVGDILLTWDGVPVNDPARLEMLRLGVEEDQSVAITLERGTAVLETTVQFFGLVSTGQVGCVHNIERGLLRVAFQDPVAPTPDKAFPFITELAEDSPLRHAGARVGDTILSFQWKDPGSAEELVRRIRLELEPGDPFAMQVLSKEGTKSWIHNVEGEAWHPGRRCTEFSLWPLLTWRLDPVADRESLMIGDLLLISLFKQERLGNEVETSVLTFLSWKTGDALLESSLPSLVDGDS